MNTIIPPPPDTDPCPPPLEDDGSEVDLWADIVSQVAETWRPPPEGA